MVWYVVDGMDGSGKTTTGRILREELESRGRKVLLIEHPNRETRLGRLEASFLEKEGKPALIAAISLYIMDVIRSIWRMKHAKGYDDVVFVRYIMAASYLPEDLAKLGYRFFSFVLPEPDKRVLVDVDENVALGRINVRGDAHEMFDDLESLRETRRKMLVLADGWDILDNSGSTDDSRRWISDFLNDGPGL